MNQEFTADEIRDAARMARVHCPGFSEDTFESLMELEKRIADSGYLDAVLGLLRLEEEKGVSCTEALDVYEELLKQKTELERRVPDLQERAEGLVAQIRQANGECEQLKKAIAQARQELAQIREEHAAAEQRLGNLKKKLEKEKQRIKKEVEDSYEQAGVTKEEVVAAGLIKTDVESHGFTIELMLGLSKEFASYKNARKELAEALQEYGSINQYLDDLASSADKERTRVIAEINKLESQKKEISSDSVRLRNVLSQLQADVAYEENLRQFHRRYFPYSGLLDKLAAWDQIFFIRCGNPINMTAGVFDKKYGNPHFWTDRPSIACPHCGYHRLYFDTEIYRYLNWPAEMPFKLNLGEYNAHQQKEEESN